MENYYELMNVPYGNGCEITSANNNAEANVRDANGNLVNNEESAHTSEEGSTKCLTLYSMALRIRALPISEFLNRAPEYVALTRWCCNRYRQ